MNIKTFVIILTICILLFVATGCAEIDKWNNGIHADCGGHYVFTQAVRRRYHTNQLYTCDSCGYRVEFQIIDPANLD